MKNWWFKENERIIKMNRENIWFLRLDKKYLTDENGKEIDTLNICSPYIYSMHGICTGKTISDIENDYLNGISVKNLRKEFGYDYKQILNKIFEIKKFLKIDDTEPSKTQCPFVIFYWIAGIKVGDIVFVRKEDESVYVCKVTQDVSFNKSHKEEIYPTREVCILHKLTVEDFIDKVKCAKRRLSSRKTLERVRNDEAKRELQEFLLSIKSPRLLSNKIIIMVIIFFILLAILIGITF